MHYMRLLRVAYLSEKDLSAILSVSEFGDSLCRQGTDAVARVKQIWQAELLVFPAFFTENAKTRLDFCVKTCLAKQIASKKAFKHDVYDVVNGLCLKAARLFNCNPARFRKLVLPNMDILFDERNYESDAAFTAATAILRIRVCGRGRQGGDAVTEKPFWITDEAFAALQ